MFFTLGLRFALIFFGFGTFALLAHFALDNAEMSVWGVFTLVISTIEVVKQGLLRNALIKFMHSDTQPNANNRTQSTSLIISLGFTVLLSLLLAIVGPTIARFTKMPELTHLLYGTIPLLWVLIPFHHFEIVLQSHFQYQANFYAYVIRQGLFFSVVVLGLLIHLPWLSFTNMLVAQILAALLAGFYLYKVAKPYLLSAFVMDGKQLRQMLQYGKYVFGTTLFGSLSRSADHFITANVLNGINPAAVSYYNAANRVTSMLDAPTTAAADILFPKNAQAGDDVEGLQKVKYYFERMVATLTLVMIPLVLIIVLFPKFILLISGGAGYLQAIPILQLGATYALLRPFIYNFGHTMDAIGKPQVNFWANVFIMLCNFAMTYYFLKLFGLMGAAYATFGMHVLYTVIFYILLKKHIGLEAGNILLYMRITLQNILAKLKR
jgi:O-antigen/teichoic acid export membrane protein